MVFVFAIKIYAAEKSTPLLRFASARNGALMRDKNLHRCFGAASLHLAARRRA
jgi:hypothetical protein